jgi:hypothetical protein
MGYFSPELARRITAELARTRLTSSSCTVRSSRTTSQGASAKKVLDFGDMDSQKWLAYAQARVSDVVGLSPGWNQLRHAEARLATQFDFVHVHNPWRVEVLRSYNTGVPVDWFPNGVDAQTTSGRARRRTSQIPSASSGAWTTIRTRKASSNSAGMSCRSSKLGVWRDPADRRRGAAGQDS